MNLTQHTYEISHTQVGSMRITAGAVRFDRDYVVFVGNNNADIIRAYHSNYIRSVLKIA